MLELVQLVPLLESGRPLWQLRAAGIWHHVLVAREMSMIPNALHICPGCGDELVEGGEFCRGCQSNILAVARFHEQRGAQLFSALPREMPEPVCFPWSRLIVWSMILVLTLAVWSLIIAAFVEAL